MRDIKCLAPRDSRHRHGLERGHQQTSPGTHSSELPPRCCGLSCRCTHAGNWLLGVQGSRRWHPPSSHGTGLGGSVGPHFPPRTPPSTGQQTQEATSTPGWIRNRQVRQMAGAGRLQGQLWGDGSWDGIGNGRKGPSSGVTPTFAHGGQCMDKLSREWVFPCLWTGEESPSTGPGPQKPHQHC